jgi:O-antigen ligase
MSSVFSMSISRPARSFLFLIFGLCPIIFFTDLTRNPYSTQIALLNIFVAVLWIWWLWEAWRAQELLWVYSRFDLALLTLIGVSTAAWLVSMGAHPALVQPIYSEGSRAVIFLVTNTFLIYSAALRCRDSSLFRQLLWVSYAVSAIASLYGIAQFFGVELIWPSNLNPYGNRPVSTFGNPNFMSSYLVVVLPVMIADYVYKATRVPRSILFLAILSSLAGLLATLTRSSWGGLLMGLAFVVWGIRRDPASKGLRKGGTLLVLAMIALSLLWPRGGGSYSAAIVDRLAEIGQMRHEQYGAVFQRRLIWMSGWDMVMDHPVLGKGWGCFELFYPFYQGPLLLMKEFCYRTHANNLHNEILEYWTQIGTLGLGIVVWMWVLFFRLGVSMTNRLYGASRGLMWGLLGGVGGMLVDNLLNVSIHFAVPAAIFWWLAGSAMAFDPAALTVQRIELRSWWRKGLAGLVALGLLCLAGRAVCMWMAEVNFFKGFKFSKSGVDLVLASRYLERAYWWHHLEVNNNYELANVYARLGEKPKALHMYDRALDANAGYDEIYFNRATMLMQMGRDQEAVEQYRICLAVNPLSHDAYNALANLYFKHLTEYAKDIEALYLQGVEIYPKDRDMWNNLGYLYTQQGDWAKAAKAYQGALEVDPTFDLARRNLATVFAKANAALKR